MYLIENEVSGYYESKKSRFISRLIKIESISDAKLALDMVRKDNPGANHNCYAYILGDDAKEYKYSDDGEPGGTAGQVIYNALSKTGLTNCILIVTRYFGGTLLGSGGLVRAYAQASTDAIAKASLIEIKKYISLNFTFDYSYTTLILALLKDSKQTSSKYEAKVTLEYNILEDDVLKIKDKLTEITNGSVIFN